MFATLNIKMYCFVVKLIEIKFSIFLNFFDVISKFFFFFFDVLSFYVMSFLYLCFSMFCRRPDIFGDKNNLISEYYK